MSIISPKSSQSTKKQSSVKVPAAYGGKDL